MNDALKRVVVICTEKTNPDGQAILREVLDALLPQAPDEIVVVHNKTHPQILPNVSNLFLEKNQPYEVASCFNLALDYCEQKYPEDFILLRLDDDSIPQAHYLHYMTHDLLPHEVRQAMLMYLKWPLADDYNTHFTSDSWLHEPVPDLDYAIENIDQIGKKMQLFSLISVIWNRALRGLRCDEQFNGNWGLEDTDFCFQLLERGCHIVNHERSCVWHCLTDWKQENHQTSNGAEKENPNALYFEQKWRHSEH